MAAQGYSEPPAPPARATMAELLGIVERAVSLQPVTESLLRSCLTPGPKYASLARDVRRVATAWVELADGAGGLPGSGIVDEACGLLRYHHRLLAETVAFAYSPGALLRPLAAARFSASLGEPAARLRRLSGFVADLLGVDDAGADSPASRLARAADNCLDLAAIAAGTLRPDLDWCDPAALVESALGRVDPALPLGRVEVSLSLPGRWAPGGLVLGDRTLLARALANTVDNAVRHGPPTTRVRVSAVTDEADVVVTVSDDGLGLPARVSAAAATAARSGDLPTWAGTGIAATIGLVAAHGGTVDYPPVATGTACVIRLPLAGGRGQR